MIHTFSALIVKIDFVLGFVICLKIHSPLISNDDETGTVIRSTFCPSTHRVTYPDDLCAMRWTNIAETLAARVPSVDRFVWQVVVPSLANKKNKNETRKADRRELT